jgi:hypothetical protein
VVPLPGFDHGALLDLSDGDREDAPEYAALKIDKIEGLTISGWKVDRIRPPGTDARKVGQLVQDEAGSLDQGPSPEGQGEPGCAPHLRALRVQ